MKVNKKCTLEYAAPVENMVLVRSIQYDQDQSRIFCINGWLEVIKPDSGQAVYQCLRCSREELVYRLMSGAQVYLTEKSYQERPDGLRDVILVTRDQLNINRTTGEITISECDSPRHFRYKHAITKDDK